jgi:hypothetical protein
MQGWWWPGRQVVVVLPLAVLAIAWWTTVWAPARVLLGAGLAVGALTYVWVLAEGLAGNLTLVVDFESTTMPIVRALRPLLPDLRLHPAATEWLLAAWVGVLAVLAAAGWRTARPRGVEPVRATAVPAIPRVSERGRSWASPFA